MAFSKTKTIDEMDDILEMAQAMAVLDISCKGLKTLDEMKDRVKDELHQSAKTPSWNAGQAFSVLSEAKAEDERKRQALLDLYDKTESYLNKLDNKMLSLLQQNMGNVKEKMTDNHKVKLEQKEYFLLVAGETGSGKSSLVNLILGEELLPYSVLSTTSTICELKFGKERQIVAHYKEMDPETGRNLIKIIKLQEGSTEQSYLHQISPYVHVKSEREKGSVFKKIELFWPHSLLEKGVVIIDSPGVGESDIMDKIVTQYLPQAFAFIYTINSANAGGVQKDRLEKLLEAVRETSLEGQGELPSKCALFVCNKWDQVPEKEIKEVKDHVIRKLQRCWPGLDPQTQIICMSTMKASKGQKFGFITEDFSTLMDGLKATILKSIEARIEIHWKWLDCLLSRIIFQAKAFVMNASRDREMANEKMNQILHRLHTIGKEQKQIIEDLNKHLKARVADAMKQLREYLSSKEVKARFTSWTLDEVPKESSWQLIENDMEKLLKNRLGEFIEQWEEDEHVFRSSRDSLIQHFQQSYDLVEEQLRNLQGAAVDDSDVPETDPTAWTTTQKVIIGLTGPIWFPLGLVALVIGSPIVGILAIKRKVEDKRKLEKYEEDKCAFMKQKSQEYLDAAKEEKVLKSFVKNQMKEANLCLKQIEARIPELIEADRMLYRQLNDETRSQKEIEDLYRPMMSEGTHLRGQLAVFGIQEVRTLNISSEELDWKEDRSSLLGRGASAEVYQGMMRRQGVVFPVALKVCNQVLDAENASLVIAEVELLRKLDHPHIVQFYGTSLIRERGIVRMILVMERCKGNLKSHITEHPESVPGKTGNSAAVREVCRWVQQITVALVYIHKGGIVHRDLKLENILVAEDDSMKITDVGFSKPAEEITGTLAGTPVYIAPEVFRSQVYDCKADIYSLGIILWEIWYGQRAYYNVNSQTLTSLFSLIGNGYRPEHVKGSKQPSLLWKQLMEKCWDVNPEKRPTASKCYEEITTLSSKLCESQLQLQAAASPLGTADEPVLG